VNTDGGSVNDEPHRVNIVDCQVDGYAAVLRAVMLEFMETESSRRKIVELA
jgi:hypothetical protein